MESRSDRSQQAVEQRAAPRGHRGVQAHPVSPRGTMGRSTQAILGGYGGKCGRFDQGQAP